MIKKTIPATLFSLLFAATLSAQDVQESPEKPNTIDQQFSDLIESSNNYQEYKVVERTKLERLKTNTRDSINALKSEITSFKNDLSSQQKEVSKLNTDLTSTQNTLDTTRDKIDSIRFLGIPMEKTGYKTLMWVIIGLLLLALAFFVVRFRGSHKLTQEARKKLGDTEAEFDAYRKKALENEQKLGRQLQDERNKATKNNKG